MRPPKGPSSSRSSVVSQNLVAVGCLTIIAACPSPQPQPSFFGQIEPQAAPAADPSPPPSGTEPTQPDPAAQTAGGTPTSRGDLSFSAPAGFALTGDWYVSKKAEQNYGYVATTAGAVRTNLPAMTPTTDIGAALRAAWDGYMPPEAKGTAQGMVFRRYVGDGLSAFYLHGAYELEPQHKSGWWTLYLVDCGRVWQPVIAGGLYEQTDDSAGFEMTAKFAIASGLTTTEPFLAALRCSGPRNQPLVAANLLAGHYYYGSGAYQEYVHIYTGATSAKYITYAGEYDLRADGRVSYQHSSAGDSGGGTQFAGENDEGTWRVDRDLILFNFKRLGARSFRVASVTDFPDAGALVFLDTRTPASPQEIRSGTFLTTKAAK